MRRKTWSFLYVTGALLVYASLSAGQDALFDVPDSVLMQSSLQRIDFNDSATALPLWTAPPPLDSLFGAGKDDTIFHRNARYPDRALAYVSRPSILVFPGSLARRCPTLVILPGGGFSHVTIDKEGIAAARWFAQHGFTTAVVKYRTIPSNIDMGYRDEGPVYDALYADAARAVRLMRCHAAAFGVDTTRIGVMGFSAGGRLASDLITGRDALLSSAADTVDAASAVPAFASLIYSVITTTTLHAVTPQTSPAFLYACEDDRAAPPATAEAFHDSVTAHGGQARVHVYDNCGHGFGLGSDDNDGSWWPPLCIQWLHDTGVLGSSSLARPAGSGADLSDRGHHTVDIKTIPAAQRLIIVSRTGSHAALTCRLFTSHGTLCASRTMHPGAHTATFSLCTRTMTPGLYVFTVQQHGRTIRNGRLILRR
jgi:acetyl esterase/lipase